jgi:hypothetical protein
VFQLRERGPRFGELVQIDGSPHDWFEGRRPCCTLIVFIDDATSRLTALRFAPVEPGKAYLDTLRDQVLTHGRPLAFYSDRHGIFRVNAKDAEGGDGKTEFGWPILGRTFTGWIAPASPGAPRLPSFSQHPESIGKHGEFGEHRSEPLDQRQQPRAWHVGDPSGRPRILLLPHQIEGMAETLGNKGTFLCCVESPHRSFQSPSNNAGVANTRGRQSTS